MPVEQGCPTSNMFDTRAHAPPRDVEPDPIVQAASELLEGRISIFSSKAAYLGSPPDWFLNPLTSRRLEASDRHWSRIAHFDSGVGDIKGVWEASRFNWSLLLAQAYCVTGDMRFLETLNSWIADWTRANAANAGPNWICGQETAIRLLHMLMTALLLDQHRDPTEALVTFVQCHCRRIEPTFRYALSQNNNHATSEAAALFVAGSWLERVVPDARRMSGQARRWSRKGRRWLENRTRHLIAEDGTFSQYSTNYQRVLIDTLVMVERWRSELALEPFSAGFYHRARAAVDWLLQMTDPRSGDAPNLGGNDGARLLQLASTEYRNFRPSVQLGARLFDCGPVFPPGVWDDAGAWLRLREADKPRGTLRRVSRVFRDGGFAVMRSGESWAVIRSPVRRFRPGVDALHFDLWHRGSNITRGSGSYSYNAEEPWCTYFGSTEAHSTVQFDGRDQLPKLSRFLRAGWLRSDSIEDISMEGDKLMWHGSYTDASGCRHSRTVSVEGRTWHVRDQVEGFASRAVLRWRLIPRAWQLDGLVCAGGGIRLVVSSNVPLERCELLEGWESRYYYQMAKLPVLEIEVARQPAVLETLILLPGPGC